MIKYLGVKKMSKLLFAVKRTVGRGLTPVEWVAVDEDCFRRRLKGQTTVGPGWPSGGYPSLEELRAAYPGDYIQWGDEDIRQSVKLPDEKIGFPQRPYPGRTAFVGPDDPAYDIVIANPPPVKVGEIHRIGETIRTIKRPGRRSLRIVRSEKIG